ncbi:MAG: winged helix-turn-helix transcriptional regulator [Deltaproteobacteria bacterium]|nr:winged helix-turn-helix transcriptional regulator [Candidatus Zymogenaceae bacterium]
MDIIQLLIQITEIFHTSITRYKQEIVGRGKYSNVTVNQLIYLEAIFHLGGPTVSGLADHLKISKASASIGVQRLIKNGLVAKTQSADDSRVQYIHLSPEGTELIEAEVKAFADFADRVKDALTDDEVKQLVEIFGKVVSHGRD